MKKFIAIFAVLLFVAPAFAADWAFYGSQRVGTWYTERDYGDGTTTSGQGDDAATQMYFQGNSRLGAKVKADKVNGLIELALKGTDGSDLEVATRWFAELPGAGAAGGLGAGLVAVLNARMRPGVDVVTHAIGLERKLPAYLLQDQGRDTVPYQGITPLSGGSLSACAEAYFAQSEQLPTAILLACDGEHAAGLLLQALPVLLSLMMYASPVIYPLQLVRDTAIAATTTSRSSFRTKATYPSKAGWGFIIQSNQEFLCTLG